MTKKFFTTLLNNKKYRVFLDDVKLICKRQIKAKPTLPTYDEDML